MSLRRSLAVALAGAAVLTLAPAAHAAGPWGVAPGEFYAELAGSYFSTTSYLDANGDRQEMGARFEERGAAARAEIGWKKNLSFMMEMPFLSRTVAPEFPNTDTYTSSGMGDIGLGLRYARGTTLPWSVQLGWTAPLGTNRRLFPGTSGSGGTDPSQWPGLAFAPLAFDSSTFFSTGLQSLAVSLDVGGAIGGNAYWTAGGGYRTRYLTIGARGDDDRFADFYSASADVGFWVSREVLLTGQFRGEWQAREGAAYDRLVTGPELQTKQLLAGMRLTYRVDDKMDVFAGSWHCPEGGENVLHHDYFYAGIAWKNTSLHRLAGYLGGTKAPSAAPAKAPAATPATTTAPTTPKQ